MSYTSGDAGWQAQKEPMSRNVTSKRTLLSIVYLLLSFPLSLFYFVFLVAGIVTGIGTVIIWIGIPILMLMMGAWWYLAVFERMLAMRWLHVDIRPMSPGFKTRMPWWQNFRDKLSNAMTWKTLAYLLVKLPLGTLSFIITLCVLVLAVVLAIIPFALALVIAPFFYLGLVLTRNPQGLETLGKLLQSSLVGFGLCSISFQLLNGMAYAQGQFARVMLGMSDTDIRLAQAKALAEQERMKAERAEQSRRELIVNVSHELRTPIASIRGHVESLLMAAEEEGTDLLSSAKLQDYLSIVHREAERLGALVDDLLSLARTEAGELHLDIVPTAAADVVEEVYETMSPLARREREITLVRQTDPALPPVMADRQRLGQVLLNLVRNAITYTPNGGIVSITLGRADATHLALTVADTGMGIPPEDLELVFERFYRTDASRARTSGGFGLGLAIVRDLVNAMGGTVCVESKVGEGSCFRVLLRIAIPGYQVLTSSVKDAPYG